MPQLSFELILILKGLNFVGQTHFCDMFILPYFIAFTGVCVATGCDILLLVVHILLKCRRIPLLMFRNTEIIKSSVSPNFEMDHFTTCVNKLPNHLDVRFLFGYM